MAKIREAKRLEALWSGEFGDAYLERNRQAASGRDKFWNALLAKRKPATVLEVGCNLGGNLIWIARRLEPQNVYGVDISSAALRELKKALPDVNAVWSPAKDLPFRDERFDLVFTAGVLIHQPRQSLKQVMREILRCSRRWVLALEYYSPTTVEVPYRGNRGALFKRDYGRLYQRLAPQLQLVETGRLGQQDGWDDVTHWLFEKR
jgi:pseudaminic acid biosynthesis-associated methylase